jgi:tetratricopeptide (TPR) repeat protein
MSIENLLETGVRAQEQGDLKSALHCFEQALQFQSTADIWLLLAEVQIENGSFAKAHKSLEAGLTRASADLDLLFALGDLFLEEGKHSQAMETYQKIIDLDPDEVDAWVSKAVAQMNNDDLNGAEKTCRQALVIDPESSFAHNAFGDISVFQGNKDSATDSFLQSIKLDPTDPQPCLSLADLYYDLGQLQQAEEFCQRGLELDAGLAEGYLILGYIYLDQDRTQESIDNFKQFLRLEKSSAAKNIRDEVSAVIDGLK